MISFIEDYDKTASAPLDEVTAHEKVTLAEILQAKYLSLKHLDPPSGTNLERGLEFKESGWRPVTHGPLVIHTLI